MKCVNCGTEVIPVKKRFGWVCFLAFFGIGYLIYHFTKQPKMCPVCGKNVYEIEGPRNVFGRCWFWFVFLWGGLFLLLTLSILVSSC